MEKLNISPINDTNIESVNNELYELNEKVIFGKTRDGALVQDRNESHLHWENGLTPELLSSALSTITTDGRGFIEKQVDFDRPVGYQSCVEVGPDDNVAMIYRKGRPGQTPMVRGREPEESNSVTVIMKKGQYEEDQGNYVLLTGYIGTKSEREPWDTSLVREEDRQKSKDFWNSHALVYDEESIDWDRTRAFYEMSKEDQKLELMSDKVFYGGIFVDPNTLYRKTQPRLERVIRNPHVTTKFNPKGADLNLEQLGTSAKIIAVGYGNDGKNEGLLVRIEAENPAIQEVCDTLETPHITLSVSEGGKAQDTEFLNFKPLDEPFVLNGEYGLYSQGMVISSESDAEMLKS